MKNKGTYTSLLSYKFHSIIMSPNEISFLML
jgi:hypothetical protein